MMKKIVYPLSLLLLIGSILNLQAQQISNESPMAEQDTIIIKQSGATVSMDTKENDGRVTHISFHKKRMKSTRNFYFGTAVDFGLNSYGKNTFTGNGDDDFLTLNTSRSTNIAFYPFLGEMKITKWFSMVGGLGIGWNNYFFEEGWTIVNNNSVTTPSDRYIENGHNTLSKSKLVTVHANLPLMFQFQVPNKKYSGFLRSWHRGFFVQAGAIGGMKVGSHTKVKQLNNRKEKDFSDFNLNLLRYELTARIGYGCLGAYVNYQMTPMFQENRGPELYPFSAGISLQFGFD